MKIYAMGVLQMRDGSCKNDRLWALYKTFEDAERAVLTNEGDIFECYYNYAMIEEYELITPKNQSEYIGPRYNSFQKQWWYATKYLNENIETEYYPLVEKCESPFLPNTIHTWIG